MFFSICIFKFLDIIMTRNIIKYIEIKQIFLEMLRKEFLAEFKAHTHTYKLSQSQLVT